MFEFASQVEKLKINFVVKIMIINDFKGMSFVKYNFTYQYSTQIST